MPCDFITSNLLFALNFFSSYVIYQNAGNNKKHTVQFYLVTVVSVMKVH